QEERQTFLNYVHSKTVVFTKNADILFARIDDFFSKAEEAFKTLSTDIKHAKPEELFCNSQLLNRQLLDFSVVEFGASVVSSTEVISLNTPPQPSFNKKFDLLIDDLNGNHRSGYTNHIACSSQQQATRFHDTFDDISAEQEVHYKTIVLSLYQGFIDHDAKIACYTDHQIFERYHKFHLKNGYAKKQAITLKELTSLEIGDYVTHIDHGIGK